MKTLIITMAMIFFGFTAAQAGCGNRSTPAAMNKCAHDTYKSTDSRMNRVYRMAMRVQKSDHKQALRKAQRSWMAFRDNACKSYSHMGDAGSTRPLLYSDCLSRLTNERTKMLELQTLRF